MTPSNGQHAQATGHYHRRRPLWLRALHRGGQVWQRLGLPLAQLDADQLLEAARQRTGLDDFGAIPVREPLQLLLHSCAHEARLTAVGRLAVAQDAVQLLRSTSNTTPFLPRMSRSPPQFPVSRGRDQISPPHVAGMLTGCAPAGPWATSSTGPSRSIQAYHTLLIQATCISHRSRPRCIGAAPP